MCIYIMYIVRHADDHMIMMIRDDFSMSEYVFLWFFQSAPFSGSFLLWLPAAWSKGSDQRIISCDRHAKRQCCPRKFTQNTD